MEWWRYGRELLWMKLWYYLPVESEYCATLNDGDMENSVTIIVWHYLPIESEHCATSNDGDKENSVTIIVTLFANRKRTLWHMKWWRCGEECAKCDIICQQKPTLYHMKWWRTICQFLPRKRTLCHTKLWRYYLCGICGKMWYLSAESEHCATWNDGHTEKSMQLVIIIIILHYGEQYGVHGGFCLKENGM